MNALHKSVWDEQIYLLVDAVERGTPITSGVYCETLAKPRNRIRSRVNSHLAFSKRTS